MRKTLMCVIAMLMMGLTAMAADELDIQKVANAKLGDLEAMLEYGKQMEGSTKLNDAEFNTELYKQVGIELPDNNKKQAKTGKKISKTSKLQKGDIVFFRNADSKKIAFSGIVYAINESGSFDFIYAAAEGVKMANSEAAEYRGNFLQASHIASDKDLKKARKAYKKQIKEAEKQEKEAKENKEKAEKQQKKAEKAKKELDKQQKAMEKQQKELDKAKENAKAAEEK